MVLRMIDFISQFSRNDSAGLLSDDIRSGNLQDRLGAIIESGDFALIVQSDQTDGHILHDIIGKSLYPGKRCPSGAIALNQKQQRESGKPDQ